MKTTLRFILQCAAALVGISLASPAPGQALPVSDVMTVGALTTTQPGGQAWAYLFWQTDSIDLQASRSFSVWQKPGDAAAAGNFTRVGVVTLQTDPKAVAGIINRATSALGESPAELDGTITSLFEKLMPTLTDVPAAERTAAKVSAVLRGVAADPKQVQSLILASRFHPAMAMAVGQAYAAKIPSSGAVTFEIREFIPASQLDAAVVGRVTVNHAVPVVLPAPTFVRQLPDLAQQGFNHLNLKMLWDTPIALRRLQPLTQGFNLYRVKRATAEPPLHTWNTSPPNAFTLASLASTPGSDVSRVNVNPITGKKALYVPEVMAAVPGDQFAVDDAMRLPGYPAASAKPKNGDQYYYFVTTRDRLGRDNNGPASSDKASPGTLMTFCDRMSPEPPTGLKVTNEYSYNNGVPTQNLRVSWKANDNAGEKKTTAYVVYRWATTDGPLQPIGNPSLPISLNPLAHLIAGPIPHVAGQATFSYLDNGLGSPAMPGDVNQTFWYTVRAIDNTKLIRNGQPICDVPPFGGNLSPNSPASYGSLRDRVGLDDPNTTVQLLCPVPDIAAGKAVRSTDNTLDPEQRFVRLIALRPAGEENIAAVDFDRQSGANWVSLGRVHFASGATSLTRALTFLPGTLGSPLAVRARTVNATGETSAYAAIDLSEPPALAAFTLTWQTSVAYTRLPLVTAAGRSPCTTHSIPGPGSGGVAPGGNGIIIQFLPPVGMKQYKLYYRIDGSPLTLAKEDSQNFDAATLLSVAFDLLPVTTSEVCLFLQIFDNDGNPSAMKALGCLTIKGTGPLAKPMLAPIASAGSEAAPSALLQWFCPPPGVETFEVWIGSSPSPMPATFSTQLHQEAALLTGTSNEPNGANGMADFTYQIFHTERVGPLFGSGSMFSLSGVVVAGQTLRVKVRAVSEAGDAGPFSNVETYTWALPPTFTGPDVPWTARPLPAAGSVSSFSGSVSAGYFPTEGFVGVLLGQVLAPSTTLQDQGRTVPQIKTTQAPESLLYTAPYGNTNTPRNMLPCVLYRTQVADLPLLPGKPLPNFPTVPGDVVQVSPLIEQIAYATQPYPGGGTGISLFDPFIYVVSIDMAETTLNLIFLKDTTPVISGARYVYLLVQLDPATKEISRVLPLPAIDIP
jgi:hypothetical protein